uniref:DUF7167 family protein n=1 Tax=Clostridium tetani TaxID=1513 RepID=UPI0029559204|nr:hypothetical protein [Clostridium tetani]
MDIGFSNAKREEKIGISFTKEEYENEDIREDILEKECEKWMCSHIDWGWEEVE